jgi:hypothetical protein
VNYILIQNENNETNGVTKTTKNMSYVTIYENAAGEYVSYYLYLVHGLRICSIKWDVARFEEL